MADFWFKPSEASVALAHTGMDRQGRASMQFMYDRMTPAERTKHGMDAFDPTKVIYPLDHVRRDMVAMLQRVVDAAALTARTLQEDAGQTAAEIDLNKDGVFDRILQKLLRLSFYLSPEEGDAFAKMVKADLLLSVGAGIQVKSHNEDGMLSLKAEGGELKATLPPSSLPRGEYWFEPSEALIAAMRAPYDAHGPFQPHDFGEHGPTQAPHLNLMLEEPALMKRHVVDEVQPFVGIMLLSKAQGSVPKQGHVLTRDGAFTGWGMRDLSHSLRIPPAAATAVAPLLIADIVRSVQKRGGSIDYGDVGTLRTDGKDLTADLNAQPIPPARPAVVRAVVTDDPNGMDSPRI